MSALTALLVFLISFALVAVLFRMPVSFALGTSSPPPAAVEAPHLPQAHLRLTPPPLLQTL